MDLNLPLILFLAVTVTGVIWLFDIVFLGKKRRLATEAVESEFSNLSQEDKNSDEKYQISLQRVSAEPVAVEYAKSFFPVLMIVFVLRSFLVEPFQIPSESMVPTLEVGDFILVNKYAYGIRLPLVRTKVIDIQDPKRGDVMVFFPPHESRYFIKRVVGLPGDTVELKNNVLYVNGEKIEQREPVKDIRDSSHDGCVQSGGYYQIANESLDGKRTHKMRTCELLGYPGREGTWVVQEGHYFMMGDNRDNSLDSRAWGAVPEERIVGKAFAIWMHWESFFSIPSFSRVGTI